MSSAKTNSRESFRMLAGGGTGPMGRIQRPHSYFHRGADDSHSDLNTANLLAEAILRASTPSPNSKSYAEEVTASHGATIRPDRPKPRCSTLRSRAIPEAEALSMLKQGFAAHGHLEKP